MNDWLEARELQDALARQRAHRADRAVAQAQLAVRKAHVELKSIKALSERLTREEARDHARNEQRDNDALALRRAVARRRG
jgi:flagellar biosynthesis chaperone FliJ